MTYRKVFFLILLFTITFFSCETKDNENDYRTSAVITGPDLGQCICCGGYFIEIGDSTYNFNTLPTTAAIDLSSESFPIAVQLDWDYENKCGDNQYITIIRIEKE